MNHSGFPLVLLTPVHDANGVFSGVSLLWAEASEADMAHSLQFIFQDKVFADLMPGLQFQLPDGAADLPKRAKLDAALLPRFAPPVQLAPVVASKGATKGSALLLKLLGQINSDAETREIEDTLKRDPQLSVQLLRLVNSVSFSLREPVTSFAQAINMLGRRQLQRWLQLLMFATPLAPGTGASLLTRAAMRGSLMEQLARVQERKTDQQDLAFIVGIFSLLDVLFGQPLADIVVPLKLADDVNAALLERAGYLGALLDLVVASEMQSLEAVAQSLNALSVSHQTWCELQLVALQWTAKIGNDA